MITQKKYRELMKNVRFEDLWEAHKIIIIDDIFKNNKKKKKDIIKNAIKELRKVIRFYW